MQRVSPCRLRRLLASGLSTGDRLEVLVGQRIRAALKSRRQETRLAAADYGLALATRFRDLTYIGLDYQPSARLEPRYGYGRPGHPQLTRLLEASDDQYERVVADLSRYRNDLRAIDRRPADPDEPAWINDFLPALDIASLYGFVRLRAPARYVEVGSGQSTRVVARARRDGGLATHITSIDPHPRATVERLCNEAIRRPLELVSLSRFDDLRPGDIVFLDGSHRVFMNSDVTVFFLDVLPRIRPGVLVGIHDITLPDDYPRDIVNRYYSEQYMLAAWLLGGPPVAIVLPCNYVMKNPRFQNTLSELWDHPRLQALDTGGSTFWFERSPAATE